MVSESNAHIVSGRNCYRGGLTDAQGQGQLSVSESNDYYIRVLQLWCQRVTGKVLECNGYGVRE
jgi:hypothetical protein